jgi:HSP20 family molecular chaperone IbpA
MDSRRKTLSRWPQGRFGVLSFQATTIHFSEAEHQWQPPINAFLCEKGVRICIDLAGVVKANINLTVEPRRVTVRGTREAPEPTTDHAVRLLALEIDYGPFAREVNLPIEIDVDAARAEQDNGLLWISLPRKK